MRQLTTASTDSGSAMLAPERSARAALRYVTAFPGRRDSYQIPLCLFESGRLERFITDGYDTGAVARALRSLGAGRVSSRRCEGLPDVLVQPNFRYEFGRRILERVIEPSRAGVISDGWLARDAASLANASGASLLLYEFQAEVGFGLLRSRKQRRILFHFHPHPEWEHPLLLRDVHAYPQFSGLVRSATRSGMNVRFSGHTRSAWKLADHILVASSCTRESLVKVGCPAERISIVPYGREAVDTSGALEAEPSIGKPYFLWVGSGSHRKGLHHLCRAWEISGCAMRAALVVIARVVDDGMEPLLAAEGIRWVRGVPRTELNWYFDHAVGFVMPSMSEGFGQVYLEAMANGCPVIGTRNSVLPDLTSAQRWIRYVEPGDIEALAEQMREMLRCPLVRSDSEKESIKSSVGEYSWARFRSEVERVLQAHD
jgi:glycosyltransferase involved in cell wall biosynthesis